MQARNVEPPTPEAIAHAVTLLRMGQVIGLPTETVYGLAADGMNPLALARIFEVKHRPLYDPLILHFSDAAAAFDLAEQIPTKARELAQHFWPGPLTLVIRKTMLVPDLATSGLPNVALRVPPIPWPRRSCARSAVLSPRRAPTASGASARPTPGR